jgi:hypothetical protein
MSVRAKKAGAVEFLTKPFRDQDLLDAIQLSNDRMRGSQSSSCHISLPYRRYGCAPLLRVALAGGFEVLSSVAAVWWLSDDGNRRSEAGLDRAEAVLGAGSRLAPGVAREGSQEEAHTGEEAP